LRVLGEELAAAGKKVLLCTTTKIYPFPGLPLITEAGLLPAAREKENLLCAGTVLSNGKLTAPDIPMEELAALFDHVLVEADGAAHRPLKAHAPHEPVIPPGANQVICLVGISGLGRPIQEAAHRPELYARLAGVSAEEEISPFIAAKVLEKEGLHHRVFLNQAELDPGGARDLADLLTGPVLAGSLQKREIFYERGI
jgi:probable selenium-dependent hydroxylase accessory protein YqeC